MRRTFRPIAVLILLIAVFLLEAWALGRIPTYVQYCEKSQHTGHEECAAYHVALFALWQIGKFFDAISPAVTAFATGAIALFTATIWAINRSQLKHGREVERAYVSGGGQRNEDGTVFQLQINNYGKTPAVLVEIGIGFCELNNILPAPVYSWMRVRSHTYKPGDHGRPVANFAVPTLREPVVYGRFRYTDIWHNSHVSSFILVIHPDSILPDTVSDDYTFWD